MIGLREARPPGGDAARLPGEGLQVHHLHAVQQDAGCARDLRELPPLHVRAARRVRQGREAPGPGRLLQRQRASLPLPLLDARRRRWDQPHGRQHRDLLRLRLEPGDGHRRLEGSTSSETLSVVRTLSWKD